MPYGPPLYGIYLGHIFCKYGGGGGGQNYFQLCDFKSRFYYDIVAVASFATWASKVCEKCWKIAISLSVQPFFLCKSQGKKGENARKNV